MKVSFDYPDPRMPRTLYYEKLCEQIRKHRDYIEDPRIADVVFPVKDTAVEPCYGHSENSTAQLQQSTGLTAGACRAEIGLARR